MGTEDLRADYAPTHRRQTKGPGALVSAVAEGSPAWAAGIEAGMVIETVNGSVPTDVIDWLWEADGDAVELTVRTLEGDVDGCVLERDLGEDWGIDFVDPLFDGIRTCRNACVFCFMAMLPEGMRASLSLRDDDYRLSFLQGNFVTLTNLTDADVERIIAMDLEPMNVSIHAVGHGARRAMMGANEARGLEVLERLMEAGIEIHGQVVLCPGLNDGQELIDTLDYVEAHPAISSLAIVPMGYTRESPFTRSYSDDPAAAREVVAQLAPYQERSREATGLTRFQLSDEFYVAAGLTPPEAEAYDGYPQFYDGIGMLRSFLDDCRAIERDHGEELARLARGLLSRGLTATVLCGEAAQDTYRAWCAMGPLAGTVEAKAIRNDYFGGDVNVTGLLCASDILAQLPLDLSGRLVVIPSLILNSDGLTLDGVSGSTLVETMEGRGGQAAIMDTRAWELMEGLLALLA